ncbi:Hsp20/alpha crystallin family protein [Psychrobacillus sp. NPDC093200]|uniref:Hsp20/alpha crystallin family protein n=1 Tax=Psychrobacillus sp. NPDC093200 TaxID=3390656 RepID=UPI003D02BC5A
MSLLPSDPFNQLTNNIVKEIERFFAEIPLFKELPIGSLRMNVQETEHEVVAICDMPGLEKNSDIKIDVINNMLTINGVINHSADTIDRNAQYMSSFHRSVSLPSPVSKEGLSVNYQNGQLEVRMPKLK